MALHCVPPREQRLGRRGNKGRCPSHSGGRGWEITLSCVINGFASAILAISSRQQAEFPARTHPGLAVYYVSSPRATLRDSATPSTNARITIKRDAFSCQHRLEASFILPPLPHLDTIVLINEGPFDYNFLAYKCLTLGVKRLSLIFT